MLLAVAQRRVGIGRSCCDQHGRRGRGKIIRNQLFEQVCGEFRKFVLELELDARGEKRRAFQQPGDHRIGAIP